MAASPFSVSRLLGLGLLASILAAPTPTAAQVPVASVDEVFSAFRGTDVPGCAVGVSRDRHEVLARAYGMADLEHRVANTPETVFEPGSVSKQVTAAATILLALDGKISLDDDVRTYLPELPDYGRTITIRHLLNHTSGLRDWGVIAAVSGWPRGSRVHTHAHVLDIASRQTALNYEPGEFYSYTNTGYNLQAVLIERVSGMPFAEFTRRRIFEPLGMTRTEWRDDYTRVVPDRAIAYMPSGGAYRMVMPFENVHGNGGLLTTVGDLLRFTHNLETGQLGGPELLREMHTQGVLNSGRTISYASGLVVGAYKGVREVQHSGATAGYRGFLTRFPDQGVAVAVVCNAGHANPTALAHEVADLYLGDTLVEDGDGGSHIDAVEVPDERLAVLAGGYRRDRDGVPTMVTLADGDLRLGNDTWIPLSASRFVGSRSGNTYEFADAPAAGRRPSATVTLPDGDVFRIDPVDAFEPTVEALAAYTGDYHSDEAEVSYRVEVRDGGLVLVDRYGEAAPLTPVYQDAFRGLGNIFIFRRDGREVSGVSLVSARVWDLRFERQVD